MKYDKHDRQAISGLSSVGSRMFNILADYEQGEFVAVPELCKALNAETILTVFSCLSGNGATQEVGHDLGVMFKEKRMMVTNKLFSDLKQVGYLGQVVVILDDYEPRRVWQWSAPQEEITSWCEMLIDDIQGSLPEGWKLKLWSRFEQDSSFDYEQVLVEMRKSAYALLVHQQLEYMKKFPNKKLIGSMKEASLRRLTEYALQGAVLEKSCPSAILIQSETPWSVKDPLYSPLRKSRLPIVHPYSSNERR